MAALTSRPAKYLLAAASVAAAVFLLVVFRPHANVTTAALGLVLVVMLAAVQWGSGPALLGSVIALLALNYFFIPPVHTLTIADPENWIAFAAFSITAIVVGQLSSRAKRKAVEAEERRLEVERLYGELQRTFEEAAEAETLRKSEKLKTALLDAVTHDLRTPLTSIKGAATTLLRNLARDSMSEDVRRELLTVIDEESDRLNRFVEEMMELAQIEGGHLALRRTRTSAYEIVNAALDRAAAALERHPVEVAIADKLPLLEVDAPSIAGVVFELLENAATYSAAGSRIAVRANAASPGWAEVAVEDEGVGIAPEHRERIFEKFFRAPQRANDGHGFGVGLAIARGIVEAHGGKIWAAANDGRGSVLRFTVPCERSQP